MKETGMRLAKKKKMKKSCENDDDRSVKKKKMKKSCENDDDRSVPYKVSYPRQYPYELRPFKDPRLGGAQEKKERFYKKHGFSDDDDNYDYSGSSEDEREDESTKVPVEIITIPLDLSSPPILSPGWKERVNKETYKRCWKKQFHLSIKNEAKNLKKRDCECAEAAIKFYNQKHGTDYEIVETLGSYQRCYVGFWFHCNFTAQCKSDDSSPPKLFFAELHRMQLPNLIVKDCVPLDYPQNRSRIVRGCRMCGKYLLHPVNGFEAGKIKRFHFSCRASR